MKARSKASSKKKKFGLNLLRTMIAIAAGWTMLTIWSERTGEARIQEFKVPLFDKQALIIYDPDPFYDLDEKVCLAFARGLVKDGIQTTVASVAAASNLDERTYDLYVLCANTYNWRPDWAITGFIEDQKPWDDKTVVAITLGSGTTASSQRALERLLTKHHARILDSRSLWLMRPNDRSRLKDSNIEIADSIGYYWGLEIGNRLIP